jgi:TM2 domain-containing membrane protein YozV
MTETSETQELPVSRALALAAAGWLVPGLGHVLLGRRARGVAFLLLVLTSVGLGCFFSGDLTPLREDSASLSGGMPAANRGPLVLLRASGLLGLGLPYLVLQYGVGYRGDLLAAGFEYGSAFLLLGALMNLLLVIDVWDIARGRKD